MTLPDLLDAQVVQAERREHIASLWGFMAAAVEYRRQLSTLLALRAAWELDATDRIVAVVAKAAAA